MNGDLKCLQTFPVTTILQPHKTPREDTVLHVATKFHRIEFASSILESGCSFLLEQANANGDTALHIAAREGHVDTVKLFFEYMQRTDDIETRESRRLKELLRMVNLKKDTALHCAARRGSYECVKLLAEANPEVWNFVNHAHESPLYLLVASDVSGLDEHIIKSAPSLASHKGPKGLTALHATVLIKNYYPLDVIESLVKWRREMIGEGDDLGMTPLHYAAFHGKTEAIKLFLQYDSYAVYILNNNDESALHLAAFNGRVKALEELVNCRPDCYNMVDNKGRTALHAAVLGNKKAVVKFILKTPSLAGLINEADKDGNTPLHLAAHFQFYGIIEIFNTNTKVCFKILNNEFLTPFDVHKKQFHKSDQQRVDTFIEFKLAGYNLQKAKSIMARHQLANARRKEMKEPTYGTEETSTNNNNKANQNLDMGVQSALEVNLLVAMLVATVTFAAGFTVPGGLVNDGEDEGLATLTNKAAFKMFIVFNTLAFCSSIFGVLFHFHTSSLDDNHGRVFYKGIATSFTAVAILAMMLAFCFGTYVVLTKSTGLSVVPLVITTCFVLLYPCTRKITFWIKVFRRVMKNIRETL